MGGTEYLSTKASIDKRKRMPKYEVRLPPKKR